jgi:hypothetical protein
LLPLVLILIVILEFVPFEDENEDDSYSAAGRLPASITARQNNSTGSVFFHENEPAAKFQ